MQKRRLGRFLAVAAFFLLWELASRFEMVNPVFVPPFTKVAAELGRIIRDEGFLADIGISLFRALTGFLAACILGILLGLLLGGWFKKTELFFDRLMDVCSQINPFLLYHVALLFLGIGETAKISIIVWTCLWPILFSTITGMKNMDHTLLRLGRSFGSGPVWLFFKVVFPAVSPSLFTGIRLGCGYAFIILIAAEMMGSTSGLGYYIHTSQMNFRVAELYASVLSIALLALGIDLILERLEKRGTPGNAPGLLNSAQY